MTEKNGKPPPGGKRPGAGRPKGARGRAVIEREQKAREAIDAIWARLTPEEQDSIGPLEAAMLIMRIHLKNSDLSGALAAAQVALPFVRPKVAALSPGQSIPADLQPDPAPQPDEPGPESPIW